MKKFKADIIVKLKNSVRDPQGDAIETVLKRVKALDTKVHSGKFFSLELEAENLSQAKEKINELALEILSNPVLEEYEIIKVKELQ